MGNPGLTAFRNVSTTRETEDWVFCYCSQITKGISFGDHNCDYPLAGCWDRFSTPNRLWDISEATTSTRCGIDDLDAKGGGLR